MRASLTYAGYELRRTFRNRRLAVVSIGFPVVLYYAIAGPNRHQHDLGGSGLPPTVYFMVGLAAFGTMNAALGAGARIAADRALGWNRQLRLTPLAPRAYVGVKVATAYALALATIILLYLAGATLGVRLAPGAWLVTAGLVLAGLAPFAAFGVALGHLLTAEAVGPAIGGTTALLALVSGVWFPITGHVMHAVAEVLPSYWLVEAGRVGVHAHGWSAAGWCVVAAWTAAGAGCASAAYRRDTRRA